MSKRKDKILKAIPTAIFEGEVLISPLPKVKFCHKIRKEVEFIDKVFIKYDFNTVIEAMKNNKIILNL